jgi:hypothetical protein
MERERRLELVRTLTRETLQAISPEKLATYPEDFARFAMTAGIPQAGEKAVPLGPREQGLDTTLVAGMFFKVLVAAEHLPASTPERISFVRKEAKNYLVSHLAGQISLSQFFRLLNLIDENVRQYFQGLGGDWLTAPHLPRAETFKTAAAPEPVRGEALGQALGALSLPRTGRGKLTLQSLDQFLQATQGRWFRLLDLEAHFGVNKKTAWGCLNQLLKADILEHNGEKANRVRYILAKRFRG